MKQAGHFWDSLSFEPEKHNISKKTKNQKKDYQLNFRILCLSVCVCVCMWYIFFRRLPNARIMLLVKDQILLNVTRGLSVCCWTTFGLEPSSQGICTTGQTGGRWWQDDRLKARFPAAAGRPPGSLPAWLVPLAAPWNTNQASESRIFTQPVFVSDPQITNTLVRFLESPHETKFCTWTSTLYYPSYFSVLLLLREII